jgi:hypothetical protein
MEPDTHEEDDMPAGLAHAGAVIDRAVEYMVSQQIGSLAIASALLGASLAMLSRSMDDASILGVLHKAIASVQSGELHRDQ